MLVMHPSLLPKYRGPCPIQHAILNKEQKTGISIIEISKKKFDAGAILH
jgi:methionyl-tRNA formyltransferase